VNLEVHKPVKKRVFVTIFALILLTAAVFQLMSLKRLRFNVRELHREVGPILSEKTGGGQIMMPLTLPQTLIGLIILAESKDGDLKLTKKEAKTILKYLPDIDKGKVTTDFEDVAENEEYYLEKINNLLSDQQIQFMYDQLPLDITRIPTHIAQQINLGNTPVPQILQKSIEDLLNDDR